MNPNDFAPPDRATSSPLLQAACALVEALRGPGCETPEVTLLLGDSEWRALEAQHRRPYRPHSSEVYMPVDGGGAVRLKRADALRGKPILQAMVDEAQLSESALTADEVLRIREFLRGPPPSWQATITGILPDVECPATFAGAKCAGQHGAVTDPRHRGQDAAGKWVEWSDGKGWTPGAIVMKGATPEMQAEWDARAAQGLESTLHVGGGEPVAGNGRLYEAKLSGVEFASSDPYPKETP